MMYDEAESLIKKKEEDFIDSWNKTRYIVYSVIQSQSSKPIEITDVIKFPWEDKTEKSENSSTLKNKEELINKALEFEKKLNKK